MPCSMRCCNTTLCNQLSCGQVTTPVADPCSSNPCQRGTCTSSNGDFECHCPSGYSGKTCDMGPLPMDCKDIINRPNLFSNRGDGVYTIMLPRSRTVLQVFCDMTYDSGGWTVFQRRVTSSQYFNRNLAEYEKGFGDINSEFWMGPTDEKYHGVVVSADYSSSLECHFLMRIISLSGAPSFTIERESSNGTYSCADNPFTKAYNGQTDVSFLFPPVATFATYDRDTTGGCAAHMGGGWWYYGCVPSSVSLPTNTYTSVNSTCGSPFYPGVHIDQDNKVHCALINLYSDSPSQFFKIVSMNIEMMIRRNN
ncbi:FCN1-like protein [Mya arenaria]|uniref:FCN1-like protein n=1 Tax=Mya arenaria TaxID=6604 RepID=A0ABY7EBM1_MYAAR|nr:FCN1-like protein [Mya arenaria]